MDSFLPTSSSPLNVVAFIYFLFLYFMKIIKNAHSHAQSDINLWHYGLFVRLEQKLSKIFQSANSCKIAILFIQTEVH